MPEEDSELWGAINWSTSPRFSSGIGGPVQGTLEALCGRLAGVLPSSLGITESDFRDLYLERPPVSDPGRAQAVTVVSLEGAANVVIARELKDVLIIPVLPWPVAQLVMVRKGDGEPDRVTLEARSQLVAPTGIEFDLPARATAALRAWGLPDDQLAHVSAGVGRTLLSLPGPSVVKARYLPLEAGQAIVDIIVTTETAGQ